MRNKLVEQLIEVHERELAAVREAAAEERAEWNKERERHAKERQELYTRIQAPEHAPALTFEPSDLKQYVSPDDDEGYWESVKEFGGTTD